jgi:hypothetical protein
VTIADLGPGFVADIELAEQQFLGVAQSIGIRLLCRENHPLFGQVYPVIQAQIDRVGGHSGDGAGRLSAP